ncbi:hypothetical protein BKA61DRAFT_696782 [Leptodontidium sp. MPI-SDFR-AT-0119]|nr:hypothetical protein BKA61DRAFT_719583 [Leptodontidium sp. MPI-SDFR-AT-0119]KAH6708884.1 hypothetical protein BKA61DRAFT_696782 [Leptodontidium sp. MPI-SDFR-AT-0119]
MAVAVPLRLRVPARHGPRSLFWLWAGSSTSPLPTPTSTSPSQSRPRKLPLPQCTSSPNSSKRQTPPAPDKSLVPKHQLKAHAALTKHLHRTVDTLVRELNRRAGSRTDTLSPISTPRVSSTNFDLVYILPQSCRSNILSILELLDDYIRNTKTLDVDVFRQRDRFGKPPLALIYDRWRTTRKILKVSRDQLAQIYLQSKDGDAWLKDLPDHVWGRLGGEGGSTSVRTRASLVKRESEPARLSSSPKTCSTEGTNGSQGKSLDSSLLRPYTTGLPEHLPADIPMDSVLELSIQCWFDILPRWANDNFDRTMQALRELFKPPSDPGKKAWIAIPRMIFIASPSSHDRPYHIGGSQQWFKLGSDNVFNKEARDFFAYERKKALLAVYHELGLTPPDLASKKPALYTGRRGLAMHALTMKSRAPCKKCRICYNFHGDEASIEKDPREKFKFPDCAEDSWEVKEAFMTAADATCF